MSDRDLSLYEPFEKLVEIEINGKRFQVPENNVLLRCVQFILSDDVVLGRFCWNDECGNCEFSCSTPTHPETERARGCQRVVEEGMIVFDLTPDLRYWLGPKLK
jgi:hypothetical protein